MAWDDVDEDEDVAEPDAPFDAIELPEPDVDAVGTSFVATSSSPVSGGPTPTARNTFAPQIVDGPVSFVGLAFPDSGPVWA